MKPMSLLLILVVSGFFARAQFSYDSLKIQEIRWTPQPEQVQGLAQPVLDLNGTWQFSTQPETAFHQLKNVQGWKNIEVPGEWVMQGFDVEAGTAAGYFRNFELPANWKGYSIKLKCEAIYSDSRIWVNGKEVGSHLGGFTPFEFDVTELVKPGSNTLAVAVKSESLADTLSSGSQYAVHPLGGITRPIYLLALPEVNLASLHVSTTFDTAYIDAELKVETHLVNESNKNETAELVFSLEDTQGNKIAWAEESNQKINLKKGGDENLSKVFSVKNPKKWDPEHPNLYILTATLKVDGREVSRTQRRVGFRQIEVRGNQVFVNNQPIKLRGVNRHEVDPLRGRSLVGNQWYEDVKIFRDGNVNYIRTSHYPPNQKLLDACDELGMFVEVEAPFCWASKAKVTNENYFEAILQPTLEMVERDKSHPCILHWSLGNESHDFAELFAESGRLVKNADPSRPRIFSQWGPDGDGGMLELSNYHYPGAGGPEKFKDFERPIVFDEYIHLNAYNRFELMTDPGVRDFWGDLLHSMWEGMYKAKGVLGGAIWAGIDDSFFLPDGHAVGYGTWGPIDGWRRTKPEYWHMKKAYSPVKIKLPESNADSLVTLEIENRYFFSNLNETRISWKNAGKSGEIRPDIEPGKTSKVKLPFTYSDIEKLELDVWKDSDIAVDQYVFDLQKPEIKFTTAQAAKFTWRESKGKLEAQSSEVKISVSNSDFSLSTAGGQQLLTNFPALMLVKNDGEGAGVQMTKETPEFGILSPEASQRKIESFEVETNENVIRVILKESYKQALGEMILSIHADGNIGVDYVYRMLENMNPRQWGISFTLPMELDRLGWQRKGSWSVYPADHIGRLKGEAQLFYPHGKCGLAGPATRPEWPYAQDQTPFGSNDFRSTKRNVFDAELSNANGTGLKLEAGGLQHVRSWTENDRVKWLVAEFDNPGMERFLRGHAGKFDRPIKAGDVIKGNIQLKIQQQ